MERYKRIQIEEREEIMKSIAGGKSLREIARKLNRNVSSISREIKRNKKGRKGNKDLRQAQYSANKAQEKAQNRQKERHKKFVLKSYVIREEVERLIMNRWSPELISGRLRKEGIGQISAESIYKWIFNEKRYLIPYLRRYNKDRVYKKRGSYKAKRVDKIKAIVRIDQRPQEITKRTVLGHWETDLVEGKGKASLKVFVERKTRFVKIIKVINKTGEESINATMKVFEKGDYPIHSITYDNGSDTNLTIITHTSGTITGVGKPIPLTDRNRKALNKNYELGQFAAEPGMKMLHFIPYFAGYGSINTADFSLNNGFELQQVPLFTIEDFGVYLLRSVCGYCRSYHRFTAGGFPSGYR